MPTSAASPLVHTSGRSIRMPAVHRTPRHLGMRSAPPRAMCMLCLCACVVNEYHEFSNLGHLVYLCECPKECRVLCVHALNLKSSTLGALNTEPLCNIYRLLSLSFRLWRVQYMGGMN
jgi:hypothetical protein